MTTLRERAKDERGRITAGLPSLSPEKRRDITEYNLQKLYQQALQSEYRHNEESAKASDGAIEDPTDIEQIAGIYLIGARIIGRLKKLNHNLWFEESKSDSSKMGIYLLKPDLKGGMTKEFICGMEKEWNPEFSLRVVDNEGNAKGIISGWRRVLSRLIRARLITEPGAFSLFGPPSRDSENWARFTN